MSRECKETLARKEQVMCDEDFDHADGMTVAAVRRVLASHGVPTETTRVEQSSFGALLSFVTITDDLGESWSCYSWSDVRDFLGY